MCAGNFAIIFLEGRVLLISSNTLPRHCSRLPLRKPGVQRGASLPKEPILAP
jgi:hypothetical protein